MIIFGLILTTFKLSIVFRGSWGSIENWPIVEPIVKFSLPKSVKRSVCSKSLLSGVGQTYLKHTV